MDRIGLRVIVCGGRDFNDLGHLLDRLDSIGRHRGPISLVIQGARAAGVEVIEALRG